MILHYVKQSDSLGDVGGVQNLKQRQKNNVLLLFIKAVQRNWENVNLKNGLATSHSTLLYLNLHLLKCDTLIPALSFAGFLEDSSRQKKVQSGLKVFSPVFSRKCGMRERMLMRKIIQCLMQRNCPL